MLSVKVGDEWLSTIGAYGPGTVEFGAHGSEAASWEMSPTLRHPLLRGNQLVDIFDGGVRVWCGTLIEPSSDGQFAARGLWYQATRAPAMDGSGNLTTVPNNAVGGAAQRGEISFSFAVAISQVSWATTSGELTLADLLDGYAAENGLRWGVWGGRAASMQVDPTTPQWHVPHAVAGHGLTPADDEFVTHLVGTYLAGAGSFASVTVGSADAATVFGRRSAEVDLTPMGIITSTRATAVLTGMFLRAGARMGWAEGLELARGQITTPGGTPVPLAQVQAGQMIRLNGTVDTSRANLMPAYTDVVIASSKYTDGSNTITLAPVGYAPRTLADVLDASMEPA